MEQWIDNFPTVGCDSRPPRLLSLPDELDVLPLGPGKMVRQKKQSGIIDSARIIISDLSELSLQMTSSFRDTNPGNNGNFQQRL